MKRFLFLVVSGMFLCATICKAQSVQPFSTRAWQKDICSVQLHPNGVWGALPIIQLGRSAPLVLSFDQINTTSPIRYRYKIIHCNADWTPSNLLEINYMDGFNDNLIDDVANSQATSVDYVNYRVEFPNDNFRLLLSGNYVLEVYPENNPSNILLTACFYVLDKQVDVSSQVSSNTDWGVNKEWQQLSLVINYGNLNIKDPYSDIKTVVLQNRRQDNRKFDLKPTFLTGSSLRYEHNRDLIFDAGNEYRRFDFVNTKSGGMNVDRFRFQGGRYYAWVIPDKIRAGKSYIYDQDQNGKFLIRSTDAGDSDVNGDYIHVNFTLQTDIKANEPIYLAGDLTGYQFNSGYEMKYNEVEKAYSLNLWLKQGAYNYMYMTNNVEKGASTSWAEGNYFQTENEYLTLVYYRPIGQRYDSLIGYSLINSQ